jgi:hypothetical protein
MTACQTTSISTVGTRNHFSPSSPFLISTRNRRNCTASSSASASPQTRGKFRTFLRKATCFSWIATQSILSHNFFDGGGCDVDDVGSVGRTSRLRPVLPLTHCGYSKAKGDERYADGWSRWRCHAHATSKGTTVSFSIGISRLLRDEEVFVVVAAAAILSRRKASYLPTACFTQDSVGWNDEAAMIPSIDWRKRRCERTSRRIPPITAAPFIGKVDPNG